MRRVLLGIHLGLVLLGPAYGLSSVALHDGPDANLGPAVALIWLALLGAPWSGPVMSQLTDPAAPTSLGAVFAAVTATALVNVLLHWAVGAWWLARSRRRV